MSENFDGKLLTMAFAGYIPATISVFLSYDQALFTTSGEIISQIAAFFMFLVLFAYLPLVLIWSLTRNHYQLQDKAFKMRYGRTIQGIKTDSLLHRI